MDKNNKQKKPSVLFVEGWETLVSKLGEKDANRFIKMLKQDYEDSLKRRDRIYGDKNVKEIFEELD